MIWVVGIPLIHPIGGALKGWAIPRGILIHLIFCNGVGLFALRWWRLVQFICHPSGLNGGTGAYKQGNYQKKKDMFGFHGRVLLYL
jgi:hypothetical protein